MAEPRCVPPVSPLRCLLAGFKSLGDAAARLLVVMLTVGVIATVEAIRLFFVRGEVVFLIVPAAAAVYLVLGSRHVARQLERDPKGWSWLTQPMPIGWRKPVRLRWRQPRQEAPETPRRRSFFDHRDLPALLLIWLAPLVVVLFALAAGGSGASPRQPQILATVFLGLLVSVLSDH
jgi:hypothetical protein